MERNLRGQIAARRRRDEEPGTRKKGVWCEAQGTRGCTRYEVRGIKWKMRIAEFGIEKDRGQEPGVKRNTNQPFV